MLLADISTILQNTHIVFPFSQRVTKITALIFMVHIIKTIFLSQVVGTHVERASMFYFQRADVITQCLCGGSSVLCLAIVATIKHKVNRIVCWLYSKSAPLTVKVCIRGYINACCVT